ncbi:MAG TPA: hypothetical protein VFV99_10410 [Kofleriaceae bacterium]|nr:hypothetical protein [Kofleriaceae bacterium]
MASNDIFARRAGRVAFGVVMMAGVPALVTHALASRRWDEPPAGGWYAWQIIVATWLLAITAGLIVRVVAPHVRMRREADALRDAALWVPSVGVALLMPLTIHMFAFTDDAREFDEWVRLSLAMVSHTHVAFAVLVYVRARALSRGDEPTSIPRIYVLTCAFALFPFVIPVVYVAITGIPIVPLLLWMKRIARLDREHVDVPFAIARVA